MLGYQRACDAYLWPSICSLAWLIAILMEKCIVHQPKGGSSKCVVRCTILWLQENHAIKEKNYSYLVMVTAGEQWNVVPLQASKQTRHEHGRVDGIDIDLWCCCSLYLLTFLLLLFTIVLPFPTRPFVHVWHGLTLNQNAIPTVVESSTLVHDLGSSTPSLACIIVICC